MSTPAENARLTLALAVGLGLIVTGVGNLLVGSRRWRGQLPFALLGVGTGAGTAWGFDETLAAWVAGVGLGLLAVLTAFRTAGVRRAAETVAAAFRSARARWAAVAAVGLVGLGYEFVRFDRAESAAIEAELADLTEISTPVDGVPVPGVQLVTDRGTVITPMTASERRAPDQLRRIEERTLVGLPSRGQLIRRGTPSDSCNCHGWVFAAGRYAIRGRQVDAILADNGYAVASQAAAGDVCVYRGQDGTVAHTAVVRAVCDDGTVLVEGKWGWLGVYLHPAQSSCYGTDYQFYHTGRSSHVLAGLPVESIPATAVGQPVP